MSIRPIGNSLAIRTSQPVPTGTNAQTAATNAPVNNSRSDLLQARDELLRVYDALQDLADLMNVRASFSIDLPDSRSASALNIDLSTTAATLQSSEQINLSPNSFTPFGPAWDSGSTALITVGGEYDSSYGSGNLSFEVVRAGDRGQDNLRIRAYEPDGSRIDNFNIRANHSLDRQYDLSNGMYFTVGSGTLFNNDTAAIQISNGVGSVFDPSLPFNGVRNSNPNFQYYDNNPLDPIVNGSFQLNGEAIAVNASDTMNAIIDRINQSSAGVTASYNAVTEQVEFLQNTTGSAPTIDIQGDTSNLIAASKLSNATVVAGIDPENEIAFQNVGAFSSIQSGSFFVNNSEITLDASADSLDDVIQKINSADAGVTASFDSSTRKVIIESNNETSFQIDSNGTDLFPALNMTDGQVDGQATGFSRNRAYTIANKIEETFGSLNELFTNSNFKDGSDHSGVFRNVLASAVDEIFGKSTGRSDELFGISFDRGTGAKRNGHFAGFDRHDFTQSLQRRGGDVRRILAGTSAGGGLINDLGHAAVNALRNINSALGLSGSYIDTFV